jgi:uncharacterized membrane protein YkvA (DUF1232 family)
LRLRDWANALKRDALTLWVAARDPRTPWAAKVIAAVVAAYALSPIDLIPDFIPVLGLFDDLLIVPLGIWMAVRLIPAALVAEFRAQATQIADQPVSLTVAAVVFGVWLLAGAALIWLLLR